MLNTNNIDVKTLAKIEQVSYTSDCNVIKKYFLTLGYDFTLLECEAIWASISDSVCATWLAIPEEYILVTRLVNFIKENKS